MVRGILCALSAFLMWGVFPVYFKWFGATGAGAGEILAHRICWSFVLLGFVLAVLGRWGAILRSKPSTFRWFILSSALISLNWGTYVYACVIGEVIQASLGYFINPLLNIAIGCVFLKERLRPLQWAAIALAAAGVLWIVSRTGSVPWIALALAGSFATYGVVRKLAPLGSLEGQALEVAFALPFALGWLLWCGAHGQNVMAGGLVPVLLAVGAGPVTVVPLLLFTAGARAIPYSLLGLLQFANPTIQFCLGLFVFGEAFDADKATGFVLVWAALAIFLAESLVRAHRNKA